MSERLVRALQKGGCAAKLADGAYQIWRQRDLRRRPAGCLSGAEVETLRVQGRLSVLLLENRQVLVWTGPAYMPPTTSGAPDALMHTAEAEAPGHVSLLQRVLKRLEDTVQQTRVAEAAFDFRADCELASQSAGVSGMNWTALSAGTRIDGGAPGDRMGTNPSTRAARRLDQLQDRLGGDTFRVLGRLIVDEVTRNAMARHLGVKPATAEKIAECALLDLAETYDQSVRRPDRLRLSS